MTGHVPKHRRPVSSAALCRQNGWGPGTLLVGEQGSDSSTIRITAVGEQNVLARRVAHNGEPVLAHEHIWSLGNRDWQPAPTPVFSDGMANLT